MNNGKGVSSSASRGGGRVGEEVELLIVQELKRNERREREDV